MKITSLIMLVALTFGGTASVAQAAPERMALPASTTNQSNDSMQVLLDTLDTDAIQDTELRRAFKSLKSHVKNGKKKPNVRTL